MLKPRPKSLDEQFRDLNTRFNINEEMIKQSKLTEEGKYYAHLENEAWYRQQLHTLLTS